MLIRKISIGPNYKDAMHYTVGQTVCRDHEIYSIKKDDDSGDYIIMIAKDNAVLIWKSFTPTIPVSVEYNIDF